MRFNYTIDSFDYEKDEDIYFTCDDFDDNEDCLEQIETLAAMRDNSSFVMSHAFYNGDTFQTKLGFTLSRYTSIFKEIHVLVHYQYIKIIVDNVDTTFSSSVKFELSSTTGLYTSIVSDVNFVPGTLQY